MTPSAMSDVLGPLVGQEIPGGCDTCDAVQTVERDERLPLLWHMRVHHDDDCPTFAAMQATPGTGAS